MIVKIAADRKFAQSYFFIMEIIHALFFTQIASKLISHNM